MKDYEICLEDRIKELETKLESCIDTNGERIKSCIDYLSIVHLYGTKIEQAEDIKEAKEWASRMISHALRVK